MLGVTLTSIVNVGFAAELEAHVKAKGPLTIGLAGAGQMGADIVVQLSLMPGVRLGAISEIRLDSAREAAEMSGRKADDLAYAKTSADIERAIEMGKLWDMWGPKYRERPDNIAPPDPEWCRPP